MKTNGRINTGHAPLAPKTNYHGENVMEICDENPNLRANKKYFIFHHDYSFNIWTDLGGF